MAGFYGNITSNPLTTYDKIYPNRAAMETAKANDGILPGRQVLIEYDIEFIMPKNNEDDSDLIKLPEDVVTDFDKNRYIDHILFNKSYDSTVWQKQFYDGNYKYVQIAELNGVGFKTIEFQKNNIPQTTVEGNEANTRLTLKAGRGINFKSYADNKNVGVENSLQFKSLKTSQLQITSSSENDEIILFDPAFNYGSSSPELSIGEGNFNFDATKIPVEEVNEYFTLDYDIEKGYYYKNYTEFYNKNGNIIEITELLKDEEVYIKTDSGKLKLLGIVYNIAQPMTYNLRNRAVAETVNYIISSKTYINKDSSVNFKYSLTSDYVLIINVEELDGGYGNYRLGRIVPSDLSPYLGNIKKVEINSSRELVIYKGLHGLESENWLTQLTKVEEINCNIKRDGDDYLNFYLSANCLPSTSTLKVVNFNLTRVSLALENDAVGNLGCSNKTILNVQNFTIDGESIDDPFGKRYTIQKNGVLIDRSNYNYKESYTSEIAFETICHINPDVNELKIQELKEFINNLAIHVNALKNLPNLTTIDFGKFKEDGTYEGEFKSYIVSQYDVNRYSIVTLNIFPHRASCPKLSRIKNLHAFTSINFNKNKENLSESSILSDKNGYIVSFNNSLEFVSQDIPITNFNAETYSFYYDENNIEIFKEITRFSPYAFGTNNSLLNIDLPPKITTLPKEIFKKCVNLKALTRRHEINQLVSIEENAIPSGVKIYYDGKQGNVTYKTFLNAVGQDRIDISESYKEALYFLYTRTLIENTEEIIESLTPQSFTTIQAVPDVQMVYIELYTPDTYNFSEGENIDTKLNTRILYVRSAYIDLTIYYGQNYCKIEDDQNLLINESGPMEISLTNLDINNTRWSDIINRIGTAFFYPTYYFSTDTEFKYKEKEASGWKTISSLNNIIPFVENKTIYLSNFVIPMPITFLFKDEEQTVAFYTSTQYKGWEIDLTDNKFIKEKVGYIFQGWQGQDIKLLYNHENGEWKVDSMHGITTNWKIEDETSTLIYAPQADTVDKEDILFPVFELIDTPTKNNIILTNSIGVLQGNLLHLHSIPLSSFANNNKLYLTEIQDYLNNTTKSSKFLGKEMIGYGYDLSHSSFGNFKIKIKNNTINSYYLNEDEEEIRLSLEEIARRKGKEYLRYSITGILKEAEK